MYVYEIGNPLNLFLSGVGTKYFIVFAAQSLLFFGGLHILVGIKRIINFKDFKFQGRKEDIFHP